MAVNATTLRYLRGLRVSVLAHLDQADQALVTAWGTAWGEVANEWAAAIDELVGMSKDGKWPAPAQVARAKRAQAALNITRDALNDLAKRLPITVTNLAPKVAAEAVTWQERIAASQYPGKAGTEAQIIAQSGKVDPRQLAAIVKRTTEQVTALSLPLSAQAEAAMRASLIKGIAVGDGPRTVAADMLARVRGGFDGGLNRALVIARTEMLSAHREASRQSNKANAATLTGWEWHSARDKRTCPSCWAQDGTVYPLDTPGPDDHQQGRCTRLPVLKSWADLGFTGITEPESLLGSAEDAFNQFSPEDQLAVMGAKRLDLLQSGSVGWSDLATKRTTPGWRDSFIPTSLADLLATAS